MSRFDLVITLPRESGDADRETLSEVMLERVGATPEEARALLEAGRVRLHADFDEAFASWAARQLEGAGAAVEIVAVEAAAETTAPIEAEAPSTLPQPRADAPSLDEDDAFAEWRPAAAPEPSARAELPASIPVMLEFDDPPPPAPSFFPPVRSASPPSDIALFSSSQAQPPAPSLPDAVLEPVVSHEVAGGALPIEIEEVRPRRATGAFSRVPRSTPGARDVAEPCPKCGTPLPPGARCPECERVATRENGLRKALRARPPLRFALGLALGLGAGYLVSAPYSRHAEARVESLRVEANGYRYRADPAEQAKSSVLDAQADEAARSAMLHVGALWLAVAAIVVAAWLALT